MDPARTTAARYAGARVQRVEDPRLLTGQGTFVDDVVRPGMLHACFVRSPFARARIAGIDTSAALALDGVYAVFTAADLNHELHELWFTLAGRDIPDTPDPPSPKVRRGSWAIRSRWSLRRVGTSRKTPWISSRSTTRRSTRSSTT